jgi:predicted neuraminidase
MKSTSPDFGRTWTPLQPTILPNPNSKIDLLRLRSGTALHSPTFQLNLRSFCH